MMTSLCQTLSVCVTLPCLGAHINFPWYTCDLFVQKKCHARCTACPVALLVPSVWTKLPPSGSYVVLQGELPPVQGQVLPA